MRAIRCLDGGASSLGRRFQCHGIFFVGDEEITGPDYGFIADRGRAMNTEINTAARPTGSLRFDRPAIECEPGFAVGRPNASVAPHVERHHIWNVPARPEKVFPLLCPVREYDWINGWRARLIHAPSGYAENGCVFETRIAPFGTMVWVCTRYEPSKYIEYTTFSDQGLIIRLRVTLCPRGDDTTILWDRSWHSVDARGASLLSAWDDSKYDAMMEQHRIEMDHYLRFGTLVPTG